MTVTADRILEREIRTYDKHRSELLGRAEGKWVLISKSNILGTFETQVDAITQGYRQLGNIPFLVKQVLPVDITETLSTIAS